MKFVETTKESILAGKVRKEKNTKLEEELNKFLASKADCALVIDEEGHYNNNNDLRRAIQTCINLNNLPLIVFMFQGNTYVERL